MIHFGTDGWRAVIGDELTFANIKILAQAICDYLRTLYPDSVVRVAIGYDARFLSKEFAEAVAGVCAGNNIRVVVSDQCVPTPVVSFVTLHGKYQMGIMITASHNPYQFNGLKIKTPDGGAADKSLTDEVEKFLHKNTVQELSMAKAVAEKLIAVEDFSTEYVAFLKKFVDLKSIKRRKMRILVDLMHGSGRDFLQRVFKGTAVQVEYMHHEFNPSFGRRNPEPIAESLPELIAAMKTKKYALGVALDGDGDRIGLVTPSGEYIDAQVLLPLLALHMVKNRKVSGGIAKTVVGSNLIDIVAKALQIELFETSVGFKYISALFKDDKIAIGGEEAGGLGYKGYIPERDGNMSALLALEMMSASGQSFTSLVQKMWKEYGRWYYDKIKVTLRSTDADISTLSLPASLLGEKVISINRQDGIKLITPRMWLMLRKSGTEPILRIYAESMSRKKTMQLLAIGKKIVSSLLT